MSCVTLSLAVLCWGMVGSQSLSTDTHKNLIQLCQLSHLVIVWKWPICLPIFLLIEIYFWHFFKLHLSSHNFIIMYSACACMYNCIYPNRIMHTQNLPNWYATNQMRLIFDTLNSCRNSGKMSLSNKKYSCLELFTKPNFHNSNKGKLVHHNFTCG